MSHLVSSCISCYPVLDRLYLAFDRVARQHQVFKVETIGDAYMVVSGLPSPKRDHAEAIALVAALPHITDDDVLLICRLVCIIVCSSKTTGFCR